MKTIQILSFSLLLTIATSCGLPDHYFSPKPECKSDTSRDLESVSQRSLIAYLKDKKPVEFRYFFRSFIERKNNTYMHVNFRNSESCFDIEILVDKWEKLSGMKKANGKSYPEELYDLDWEIVLVDGVEGVTYVDMHQIID